MKRREPMIRATATAAILFATVAVSRGASSHGMAAMPALPYFFEQNVGQAAGPAKFMARRPGAAILLSNEETVLRHAKAGTLRWRFPGIDVGSSWAPLEGVRGLSLQSYVGDRSRWRTNIPVFAKLIRRNAYPGIDLIAYGKAGMHPSFEYDVAVSPGADVSRVVFEIQPDNGVQLRIDAATGDIVAGAAGTEFRHQRPTAFQVAADGARVPVVARYRRLGEWRFGFEIERWDPALPLIIDPVVVSSATYVGGRSDDVITYANDNTACGYTASADMPGVSGAVNGTDAFVVNHHLGAVNEVIVFGGSGNDRALASVRMSSVFVAGETDSTDFPVGELSPSYPGGVRGLQLEYGGGRTDGFVAALTFGGGGFASYWGGQGTDRVTAVDSAFNGNAVIVGETDSPQLLGSSLGGVDAFAAVLTTRTALVRGVRFGGAGTDRANGVRMLNFGAFNQPAIAVGGSSDSGEYGATAGSSDAYLEVLQLDSLESLKRFWFGGSGAEAVSKLDWSYGLLSLSGSTASPDLTLRNPAQASYGGNTDGFFASWDSISGELVQSSYWGGSGADVLVHYSRSSSGWTLLAGSTNSTGFPLRDAIQSTYGGGASDGFLSVLDRTGTLMFSTYAGGPGEDSLLWAASPPGTGGQLRAIGAAGSEVLRTDSAHRAHSGGQDLMTIAISGAIDADQEIVAAPGLIYNILTSTRASIRVSDAALIQVSSDLRNWASEIPVSTDSRPVYARALASEGRAYVHTAMGAETGRILFTLAPLAASFVRPFSGASLGPALTLAARVRYDVVLQFGANHPSDGKFFQGTLPANTADFQLRSEDPGVLSVPAQFEYGDGNRSLSFVAGDPGSTRVLISSGSLDREIAVPVNVELPGVQLSCPAIGRGVSNGIQVGNQDMTGLRARITVSPPGLVQPSPDEVTLGPYTGIRFSTNGYEGDYRITVSGPGIRTTSIQCSIRPVSLRGADATQIITAGTSFRWSAATVLQGPDGTETTASLDAGVTLPVAFDYAGPLSGPRTGLAVGGEVSLNLTTGDEPGLAEISARLPEGYREPVRGLTSRYDVRRQPLFVLQPVQVGANVTAAHFVSFHSQAGSRPAAAIRVRSSDPTLVRLSTAVDLQGGAEITIPVLNGNAEFAVHGMDQPGKSTLVASVLDASGAEIAASEAVVTVVPVQLRFSSDVMLNGIAMSPWSETARVIVSTVPPLNGRIRPGFDPGVRIVAEDRSIAAAELLNESSGGVAFFYQVSGLKAGRTTLKLESDRFPVLESASRVTVNVLRPKLGLSVPTLGAHLMNPAVLLVVNRVQSGFGFRLPNRTVTLRSMDPSRLLLSAQSGESGSAQITVVYSSSQEPRFWIHALQGPARVLIRPESEGWELNEMQVELTGTAAVITWPPGGSSDPIASSSPFQFAAGLAPVDVNGQLLPEGEAGVLRPGAPPVNIPLTATPGDKVRITPPVLLIPAGSRTATAQVDSSGEERETEIRLETPPGFQTAATRHTRIRLAGATPPTFRFSEPGRVIGQQQSAIVTFAAERAASSDLTVRVSTNDAARMRLATEQNSASQDSITFTVPRGNSQFRFAVHSYSLTGEATISVAVGDAAPMTVPIQVAPSWIGISAPETVPLGGKRQISFIFHAALPSMSPASSQFWSPRPGYAPGPLPLSVSPTGVLNVPPSISLGTAGPPAEFVATAVGTATITLLKQPEGLTEPATPSSTRVTVALSEVSANVPDRIGKDSMEEASVNGGESDTITVETPTANLIQLSTTAAGPLQSRIEFTNARQSFPRFFIHGLAASGAATLTVRGSASNTKTVPIQLTPTGFAFDTRSASLPAGQSETLRIQFRRPDGAQLRLRPGASPQRVPVQSSDLSVLAPASGEVVVETGIEPRLTVRAVNPGNATLTLTQPAGFQSPGEMLTTFRATVTDAFFQFNAPRVAANMRTPMRIGLTPPATSQNPVPVTVEALDPEIMGVSFVQGQVSTGAATARLVADGATVYLDGIAPAGGRARFRVSASGYRTAEVEVTVLPSGVVFDSTSASVRIAGVWSIPLRIVPLSAATLQPVAGTEMTLRPGVDTLAIEIQSSNNAVGLGGSPVRMVAGQQSVVPQFVFQAAGETTLRIVQPEGFVKAATRTEMLVSVE